MAFGINHEQATQGGLIPEGEYEVIIHAAHEDATGGGTIYFSIPLIVRNDVEQPYKNAFIWHALWKRKEPTAADMACGGYGNGQIQMISKAAGLENGRKFEDLRDWGNALRGRLLRVTVKHEEYQGKVNARVAYVNSTKRPNCNHQFKDKKNPEIFREVESDDDLPF